MNNATSAHEIATAATVPPVDLAPTGKLPALLNGIPGQPKPQQPAYSTLQLGSPQARVEQADLDEGVKVVYKQTGPVLKIAYDPAQISALDARDTVSILADYTEGEQIDKLRTLGQSAENDIVRAIFNVLLGEIDRTGDAGGVLAHAERLITGAAAKSILIAQAPCPRYSWCIETGEHDEHTSDSLEPSSLETDRREFLAAGLTHWSKGLRVGFLKEDLTPAEARIRVAELRAHLDAVEQLIDTAEATA